MLLAKIFFYVVPIYLVMLVLEVHKLKAARVTVVLEIVFELKVTFIF